MRFLLSAPLSLPIARLRLIAPIILVAVAVGLWPALGMDLDRLIELTRIYYDEAMAFYMARPFATMALFVCFYAVAASLSLPVATLLTLTGGHLFGIALGTFLSLFAASLGAVVVFSLARLLLPEHWGCHLTGRFGEICDGFRRDAFSYMLFLRLAPVFPFWLVNLLPAYLGVRFRTYLLASILGMAPGSLAIAAVGDGLFWVLLHQTERGVSLLSSPEMVGPLIGLFVLSVMPVAVARLRRSRDQELVK